MKKIIPMILIFVFIHSCTQVKPKPVRYLAFSALETAEVITHYRQCIKELVKVARQEDIGLAPWGTDGDYILHVSNNDIKGANELFEEYRYKPNSGLRDAAFSATYLLVSQDHAKSFVIPNFHGDPNFDPMGRIKVANKDYYFSINAFGAPSCFYDSQGKNINPYQKVALTCPAFNRQAFVAHNRIAKKNPLVKLDQNQEHYSFFKEIEPEELHWIVNSSNKSVGNYTNDIIIYHRSSWISVISQAERLIEKISPPDSKKIINILESDSCRQFEASLKAIDEIQKRDDENMNLLNHYNN